jgi:hypothetical protein
MSQFWRNSLIIGIALFLETCAFYLVFTIVTTIIQLPEAGIPFWLVFLALLWAFILSWYIQTISFSLNLRGVFGLIVSIVSLLILSNLSTGSGLIPFGIILGGDLLTAFAIVLSLAFLVVLWWRGGTMAQDDITLDSIRSTFQWGLVVVFIAVLIDALTSANVINGFLIVGFFGVGLVGLSLARFSSESGDSAAMSRDWLVPICVTVGGVLLLGLLISALGMGGLDDVTRAILGWVGNAGLWILRPILLGLGLIAAGLVALGNWLASVLGGGDLRGLELAQEQIRQFHQSLEEVEQGGPPPVLIALLKWSAFLGASALVVWLLFRLFRFRRFLRNTGEVEETRESLFTWERANQDLVSLLNRWWNNLVQGVGGEGQRPSAPRNPRELYYSFLVLAEELGYPRREWQTPKEHQRTLGWLLPPEPVGHIVDGFQLVHYGHGQIDDGRMQQLLKDWSAIRQFVTDQQQSQLNKDQPDRRNH